MTVPIHIPGEISVMRLQTRMVQRVARLQLEGLTQAECLLQPSPGGNCLNWVVGHVLAIYGQMLPVLDQLPVLPPEILARYHRGSAPITQDAEALDVAALMKALDESCQRFDAGLAVLTRERIDAPAPFSPSGNPDETVGSLLTTICWHQAYHAGQMGLLRRLASKTGAIK